MKTSVSNLSERDPSLIESGLRFNFGSVIFDRSRDIIIPMTIEQYNNLNITLNYESPDGEKT
jgi:hypothetical protein